MKRLGTTVIRVAASDVVAWRLRLDLWTFSFLHLSYLLLCELAILHIYLLVDLGRFNSHNCGRGLWTVRILDGNEIGKLLQFLSFGVHFLFFSDLF